MSLLRSKASPGSRVLFAPWPHHDDDEVEAVASVLRSGDVNYWTGQRARAFEREYAAHVGRKHGIALANGTVALELALHAFGVGPGDEVITTSRTFIASASAAVMRGATPVIADVDRETQNISVESIAACVTPATRAIIAVHLAGWPCDMAAIMDFAADRDLIVIEDCAQANGACIDGRPVGGFGHAATFSFCQDKIITTGGEGGLLVLDDDQAWSKAWSYKDHGKSFEAVYERVHPPGYRWLHESFGTNWRMTEMQAAIGRLQLAKLPRWSEQRNDNARTIVDHLEGLDAIRVPRPPRHVRHAYYKLYVFVVPDALGAGWDRDRIMNEVTDAGVPCFSGSCGEIYRELAFTRAGLGPSSPHPVARELGDTSLMLLVHPTLSADAIAQTAEVVRCVVRHATR